jgi:uncharacterized protein (DUF433 family)
MEQAVYMIPRIPPQTAVGSFHFNFPSTLVPGEYISGTGKDSPMIFQSSTSGSAENLWQNNLVVITVSAPAPDPIIEGTGIHVYRISALLDGGMTISQVLQDFPSLTVDKIILARAFAKAHPNFGKQYPKRSLKGLLRRGSFCRLKKELAEV